MLLAVALVGFGGTSGGFVWDVARLASFHGLGHCAVAALFAAMASLWRLLLVGDGVPAWIARSGGIVYCKDWCHGRWSRRCHPRSWCRRGWVAG
jgi:hypothetical protein